ncbi:CopY family transcriptional regulator [candidate division GN15 bacterium]|uniref:CopY family transcriptional regulator n=1 Tax=candidate division GN15 bacterium TaxID=2072418 RepID=A0A855WZ65_9BACT|nr:MAG: CopY family transcriptional regulator [candidate division GN15 bacterium]
MARSDNQLTKRERQIMDILYRLAEASAGDIHSALPDPPTYSTVRKLLSILEEKGLVRHIERDRRYVYLPARPKREARRIALKHLVETFFENSTEGVVAALMDMSAGKLSDEDFTRLTRLIEQKRKERV